MRSRISAGEEHSWSSRAIKLGRDRTLKLRQMASKLNLFKKLNVQVKAKYVCLNIYQNVRTDIVYRPVCLNFKFLARSNLMARESQLLSWFVNVYVGWELTSKKLENPRVTSRFPIPQNEMRITRYKKQIIRRVRWVIYFLVTVLKN